MESSSRPVRTGSSLGILQSLGSSRVFLGSLSGPSRVLKKQKNPEKRPEKTRVGSLSGLSGSSEERNCSYSVPSGA